MVNWITAPTVFDVRHVLAEFYGDTDTGRTTLALSAPGPIAFLGFGEKVRGVIEKVAQTGKLIQMVECGGDFRGGREDIKAAAGRAEALMFEAAYDALGSAWCRSLVIDTHNDAWQLSRYAEFGGAKPERGRVDRNYAEINNRWRQLLVAARRSAKNVILIGMTEAEWLPTAQGQDKKTGRTIRATHYTPLPTKVDVSVRTYSAPKPAGPNGPVPGKTFASQIEKAWMNAEAAGVVLQNELSTFANIMAVITGTDPREWS